MTLAHQPHQPEVALAHQVHTWVTLVPQVPPVTRVPLAVEYVKPVTYEKM